MIGHHGDNDAGDDTIGVTDDTIGVTDDAKRVARAPLETHFANSGQREGLRRIG